MSVAVTVRLPEVFKVTLKVPVPDVSAALLGNVALASDEVMPTVSVTVLTKFQFASTALTVTLNVAAALCAAGEPDLPVPLPGEAVSPGARICNFANTPAF